MKQVVVACGSGVATSTMVGELLKNALAKRGIQVEVKTCDFKSLRNFTNHADVLISIAPYEKFDYGIPVVNGIPLLTGVNTDQTIDEVVKILSGK